MNTPWNLEETRKAVEARYGREQLALLRRPLQSVADREAYAEIHFRDACTILDRYVTEKLLDFSLLEG